MKKLLMHKNDKVAEFIFSQSGNIGSVKVINKELFPYSSESEDNSLKRFLLLRKTACNRPDLAPIAGFYGNELLYPQNYTSLFDCYWIKENTSNEVWEDVSLFSYNDFSNDGVYLSIVNPRKFVNFQKNSPNLTLPTSQPLYWYNYEGELGLINADAQFDMINMKIAKQNQISILADRKYVIISGRIYTFKKTETSEQIERIPFDQLYLNQENPNKSATENLKECCEKLNIPGWDVYIKQLLQLNKLLNKKIELSDLGVLRNTQNLKYIGFDKL